MTTKPKGVRKLYFDRTFMCLGDEAPMTYFENLYEWNSRELHRDYLLLHDPDWQRPYWVTLKQYPEIHAYLILIGELDG